MSKSRYVRLKDLIKLAKKYPNAVLSYPVDKNSLDYSYQLAGEFYDELIEMNPDYVGCGSPRYRHVVVIK